MRHKYAFRKQWANIQKCHFKSLLENDTLYVLTEIEEVSHPFCVGQGLCISDKGYDWLDIAKKGTHVWTTVMFDRNKRFFQAYYDITSANHLDDIDNAHMDDLFLDLVLDAKGQVTVLDEDELELALRLNQISLTDYTLAKEEADKLHRHLQSHYADIIEDYNRIYQTLKGKTK